jgi:hypothetical protein
LPCVDIIVHGGRAVKSTEDLSATTQDNSGCTYALLNMPRSCKVIFDFLYLLAQQNSVLEVRLADLGHFSRLSIPQVHKALRRLEAFGLIRWERSVGRGHRSRITLLPLGDSQDLFPNQSLKGTNFYDPHPPKVPNNSGKRGVIHSQKGRSARKEKS